MNGILANASQALMSWWTCSLLFYGSDRGRSGLIGQIIAELVVWKYGLPMAINFTRLSQAQVWSWTPAALLNNVRWQKTLQARCSGASPFIHEVLIAAAATASLFIRAPHVFMFYTSCRFSLPSFTPPPQQPRSACLISVLSLQFTSFVCFRLFPSVSSFVSMEPHIWLCFSVQSRMEATARSLFFQFPLCCSSMGALQFLSSFL